jgi:hypothetical protein
MVNEGTYPPNRVSMVYSSSLSDAEWEILEPLLIEILPPKKQTRPSNWTKREILNGILSTGCGFCANLMRHFES